MTFSASAPSCASALPDKQVGSPHHPSPCRRLCGVVIFSRIARAWHVIGVAVFAHQQCNQRRESEADGNGVECGAVIAMACIDKIADERLKNQERPQCLAC